MFQQNNSTMSSIIGSDLEIKGDINIKGDLLIYGIINGNIDCEGMVTTAKGSEVNEILIQLTQMLVVLLMEI